jgi:hypothetical protein
MTKRNQNEPGVTPVKVPAAPRQIAFHQLLAAARKTLLMDALSAALGQIRPAKLKSESPTTNSWFDAPQVLGREGGDWMEFHARLAG